MTDFIEIVDNALPAELCARLIELFEANPSQQTPGRTGFGVDATKKCSRDITLDCHSDWNPIKAQVAGHVFEAICNYATKYSFLLIGALSPVVRHPRSGVPITLDATNFGDIGAAFVPALVARCFGLGTINLQKYDPHSGGYPHWHSEIYPQGERTDALHRVLFWICYLNDVQEGGETEFSYQKRKVTPQRGRLLIAPAGFTHTHRGNTPLLGPKYVLTSWLMYQASDRRGANRK